MKEIKSTNENEIVLEFLKMELNSERFSNEIKKFLKSMKLDVKIITNGNLLDNNENEIRSEILGNFRGYKKNKDLFRRFPTNISWHWAIFEEKDLSKIKYINYSYWNELSNYTSSPLEAAKTILSGKEIYEISNKGFLDAAEYLKSGGKFPPLIVLTDMEQKNFIVVEGHKRITAYALEPKYFSNVKVLLGYCCFEDLIRWNN